MNCSGASNSFFSKFDQIEKARFDTSIYTCCSGLGSGTACLKKGWTVKNSEELLLNVVKVIRDFGGVFNYDSYIPYNNFCFDMKNKVFGFVLLKEHHIIGGMTWNEAVYGCRVAGRKLFISCLDHGYGDSNPRDLRHANAHYRFLTKKLQKGAFHFVVKRRSVFGKTASERREVNEYTKTVDMRNIGRPSGAE